MDPVDIYGSATRLQIEQMIMLHRFEKQMMIDGHDPPCNVVGSEVGREVGQQGLPRVQKEAAHFFRSVPCS